MGRQLVFSVTRRDFRIDTFRAGGKGGSNQNKRDTGVRIVHVESGAVGESRTARTQGENKKLAFRRLLASERWKHWFRIECARRTGSIEASMEAAGLAMAPENLKVEIRVGGRWIEQR